MKKRCRKSYAKNIGKTSNKSSKIDAKTIKKPSKNRCEKRVDFWKLRPVKPGPPQGSGKSVLSFMEFIREDRKTTKGRQPEGEEFREEHAERPTSTL